MLHFGTLGRIAAYPSVVGFSLAMLALGAARRHVVTGARWPLAALGLLTGAVTLIHPLSVPTLVFGTSAVCWQGLRDNGVRRAIPPILAVASGGLLTFCWPYFPVIGLAARSGEAYDLQQYPIYQHLVERTFPILLALPLLVGRLRKDVRDPIATTFCALAAAIAFGGVSGRYSLGRLIPGAILMVHLALAYWIATSAVSWLRSAMKRSRAVATGALVGGTLGLAAVAANFEQSLLLCLPGNVEALAPYAFLRGVVRSDDVVLADAKASAVVPALAGRVVAVTNALPFVPDAAARRHAVSTFFDGTADAAERNRIIETYAVRWVLLDRQAGTKPELEAWLRARGTPVHDDERFLLVAVAKSAR
jgi:alpha-1,6-mannosyltransferase